MRGPSTPEALDARIRDAEPSPNLAMNERCDALRRQGRTIYKLGLGQSPFPVPASVVATLREHAARKEYLPVQGLPELRAAVARRHHLRSGLELRGDDVIVGPGCKELLFLLQVVHDAELVMPTPAWVSYIPQARLAGRAVAELPLSADEHWCLTPAALDAHCRRAPERRRVLILNYPCNPTGATYTQAQLGELAEVARRYGVLVVSDEIYGELYFDAPYRSIARDYPEGTIVCDGLSKWAGAGGWRLGTFAFPSNLRWLLDAMRVAASETYTTASAPVQLAAVTAFEGGPELDVYLDRSRRILAALGRTLADRLIAAGVRVERPDGAFYLYPDFSPFAARLAARGIHDDGALARRLVEETGVAMLPGSACAWPRDALTARLAYVDFDGGAALDALSSAPLDAAFLQRHAGSMLEAIDRMVDFVRA